METPRFQINTFPSDDEELSRFVSELVAAVSGASDGLVAWLESALRERYPQATVAARSELAEMHPSEPPTVYVYRDGSPLPSTMVLTGPVAQPPPPGPAQTNPEQDNPGRPE